jgi:hypothetical protein
MSAVQLGRSAILFLEMLYSLASSRTQTEDLRLQDNNVDGTIFCEVAAAASGS